MARAAKEKKPKGRPSDYTPEIAAEICSRLASGESLRSVCRDERMPHEATVRGWVIDDREGFSTQYARSRDLGLDCLADELLEIADTPQPGVKTKIGPNGAETTEGDMIDHRRLRVDSRKWYLSKLAPKKYGDKLNHELTGKDGGPIATEDVSQLTPVERAQRLAALLNAGRPSGS